MRLKIGRAFRIDVFLHWTFVFAPAYVIWNSWTSGDSWHAMLLWLVILFAMFGCILLHEFGHALSARIFKVETKDIIITPLGGLARLVGLPRRPLDEFVITICGPLVNLVIALLAAGWTLISGHALIPDEASNGPLAGFRFSQILMLLNLALFLFNLIPAFPMDGGRIFRSLLAMVLNWQTATMIASGIGQLFGAAFVGYGIYSGDILLAMIGIFVIMAARAEYANSLMAPPFKPEPQTRPGDSIVD